MIVSFQNKHHWEDNIPENNSTLKNKQHQLESSDKSEDKNEEKEEQEEYEEKTWSADENNKRPAGYTLIGKSSKFENAVEKLKKNISRKGQLHTVKTC